jgi:hypothetical protein
MASDWILPVGLAAGLLVLWLLWFGLKGST